jgi:hypothetical protein
MCFTLWVLRRLSSSSKLSIDTPALEIAQPPSAKGGEEMVLLTSAAMMGVVCELASGFTTGELALLISEGVCVRFSDG